VGSFRFGQRRAHGFPLLVLRYGEGFPWLFFLF